MIYTFSFPDETGKIILDGYVQVEPIKGEPGEANILGARGVGKEQAEFEEMLERIVYGKEFPHLGMELGEEEAEGDVFNKYRLSHWGVLPHIFRIQSGYGGVEEFTNEEFIKLVEESNASD